MPAVVRFGCPRGTEFRLPRLACVCQDIAATVKSSLLLLHKKGDTMNRRIIVSLFVLSLVSSLSACGDTWRGVKKDTGENMQKTGEAIERAGESVKP